MVRRHLRHPDRAPVPDHTRTAFEALQVILQEAPTHPLVLDSGCGRGDGALALTERHPEAWVIGVDRSVKRLNKGPFAQVGRITSTQPVRRLGQAMVIRADIPGLWRLLLEHGYRLEAHYLLFPNPWPKSRHLMRRWHGHPAWARLLALGGRLEMRANWSVYAEEMQVALRQVETVVGRGLDVVLDHPDEPSLTHFERKYRASGHELYRIRADLGSGVEASESDLNLRTPPAG